MKVPKEAKYRLHFPFLLWSSEPLCFGMMLMLWDMRLSIHLTEKRAVAAKGLAGRVSLRSFVEPFWSLPGISAQ